MGKVLLIALVIASTDAQQVGKAKEEVHLAMPVQECSNATGCVYQKTAAVLDSNWRWLHHVGCSNSSDCNCFLGNVWMNKTCSTVKECTDVCALEGEDVKGYREKYGIQVDGSGLLNLTFVTHYEIGKNGSKSSSNGTNVGSRMYLMETEDKYKIFKLLNRELSFVVDGSNLPCGLNGAIYFVEMDEDGGMAKHPTNKAGAKYGTGYCDAQCPHDMKWINGEANLLDWNGSSTDPNVGHGHYGTCCAELDIWEANSISTQMTVHSCDTPGNVRCEGVVCGDNAAGERFKGECDKNGCDFNPYREGAHKFFGPGPGHTLDSTRPMRVVTQFITDDGTDNGTLVEMRRFYVQDNKTIYNPTPDYGPGPKGQKYDSISEEMCSVQMDNFTDRYDVFSGKGGVKGMGEAMRRGMTMVFSLWDDHDVGMIWLDATDPFPVPAGKFGAPRGTCNQTSGNYSIVEKLHADAYVLYSDVRYGEIGTTGGPSGPPPAPLCPGGDKDKCIATCDPSDPAKYLVCVKSCDANCPHFAYDAARSKVEALHKREILQKTLKGTTLNSIPPAGTIQTNIQTNASVNDCIPSGDHGCLDGISYDFSLQFPCGSHNVFGYTDHACCDQGTPFLTGSEYCCTGSGSTGVHDYGAGKCDLATPDQCACTDAIEVTPLKKVEVDALIDTAETPEGGYLCKSKTDSVGCLNGYPYEYSTHAPCGEWLMGFQQYGCCPSSAGFLPYQIGHSYCCKIEGAPTGQDYKISTTPCKCHKYGC